MHMFTAAFRALDLALFVFRKAEDDFEGLLAIFAVELIAGHDDLQTTAERTELSGTVYAPGTLMSRQDVRQ
jgi:hypothetical protein